MHLIMAGYKNKSPRSLGAVTYFLSVKLWDLT